MRICLLLALVATISTASAQTSYYWSPASSDGSNLGGNGTWTNTSANWWNGSANVAFPSSATRDAIFSGASGNVGLNFSSAITVRKLIFETGGYTLSASSPANIALGASATGVEVNNSGTTTIGSNVTISAAGSAPNWLSGHGTLAIGSGATLAATHAGAIASISGGAGLTLDVLSGGAVTSANDIYVGSYATSTAGEARLQISGGSVTAGRNLQLAVIAGGKATLDMNDGTLNVTNASGVLRFGQGTSEINLNGGVINANQVSGASNNNGVFNFNGGTLKAANANTSFFTGVGNAYVKEGGAKIDTNGVNVTVSQVLKHGGAAPVDGGLVKTGTGTLTLSGANTYTGITRVSEGTVLLGNVNALQNSTLDISGAGSVAFGVEGDNNYKLGGITGEGTLNAGTNGIELGALSLDGTPQLAEITANSLSLGGPLEFILNGTARGSEYSAVNLSGDLVYGGVLTIALGFMPADNTAFELFDFSGGWSGAFSAVNVLDADYVGAFDYSTGILTLTAVPEPAIGWMVLGGGLVVAFVVGRRRPRMVRI